RLVGGADGVYPVPHPQRDEDGMQQRAAADDRADGAYSSASYAVRISTRAGDPALVGALDGGDPCGSPARISSGQLGSRWRSSVSPRSRMWATCSSESWSNR